MTEKTFNGDPSPASNCSTLSLKELEAIVRKDLKNICCIYRTIRDAFFQEAEDRLVQRIAHSVFNAQNITRLQNDSITV